MEQIIFEQLVKATEAPVIGDLLKFAGLWWIISSRLTNPIRAELQKVTEAILAEQINHAQQLSLLKQDLGYTKSEVSEIKKKINAQN